MERRKFTREFKLEPVKLIKDRGVAYAQVAALFAQMSREPRREVGGRFSTRTPFYFNRLWN